VAAGRLGKLERNVCAGALRHGSFAEPPFGETKVTKIATMKRSRQGRATRGGRTLAGRTPRRARARRRVYADVRPPLGYGPDT
jgi:hypothetical protein